MGVGLRTRDASGAIKIDTSTRVGHLLGSVVSGTSNGSAGFDLAGGQGFCIVLPLANGPGGGFNLTPEVDFDYGANRIVWSFPPAGEADTYPVSCLLIVGKF